MPCRHREGSKDLAPLILDLNASWRCVIKATTRPLYPREGTHVSDAGWAPESVWTGAHKTKSLVYWIVHHCDSSRMKKPTRCHLLYLLYFLDTRHVSGFNMSIFRGLRLCCWTTTSAVLFLDCCLLDLGCGSARVVSGLPASRQPGYHPSRTAP